MTMTTALPKLNLNLTTLPSELMIHSITHPSVPSWLVMRRRAVVTTVCDICGDLVSGQEDAYYETGRPHPAHAGCWFIQLTARPVRVISVRYR
jgi:hypothetical protein